uniref:Uncharacterized protein n=1 Tax=Pipistrellus kuhlii TaxID=59472 RepID=A0A7J7VMC5_PIPKU|nr:hypothetical protein mPipKuh1_008376 [Pipistrellus kuhlii]
MCKLVIRNLYNLRGGHSDKCSDHLTPYTVITILEAQCMKFVHWRAEGGWCQPVLSPIWDPSGMSDCQFRPDLCGPSHPQLPSPAGLVPHNYPPCRPSVAAIFDHMRVAILCKGVKINFHITSLLYRIFAYIPSAVLYPFGTGYFPPPF